MEIFRKDNERRDLVGRRFLHFCDSFFSDLCDELFCLVLKELCPWNCPFQFLLKLSVLPFQLLKCLELSLFCFWCCADPWPERFLRVSGQR